MRLLALLVLALTLVACGSEDSPDATDDIPLGELATSPGEGIAGAASNVRVDVRGTLEDGTVFQDDERIVLPLAGMTPGFARGVAGMSIGETKTFEVPPQEAYGDSPPPGIPPGATLTYEVTLHEILDR